MDKIKTIILEIKFYFFSTFMKITVEGFVNQLIQKFWPKHGKHAADYYTLLPDLSTTVLPATSDRDVVFYLQLLSKTLT